jgi:hypothetical protein
MTSLMQSRSGVLPAQVADPFPQALRYGIFKEVWCASAWLSCQRRLLAWLSRVVDTQNTEPTQGAVSSANLHFLLGMNAQVSMEKI